MSIFFTYNDKIFKEGQPVISAGNRSLRYGDGLFETIKMIDGKIILEDLHFERLFSGMGKMHFQIPQNFSKKYLIDKVVKLCKKNQHTKYARVRLMIFRGSGGLYDAENNYPHYIIETWEIEDTAELNSNGFIIDIYQGAKKSCDEFSNLKNNNFLPYVMGAFHAKNNKLNDCIILNNYERICDTTIANIFIIKDDKIYTPSLNEGCVAGVMRKFIIDTFSSQFTIIQMPLTIENLQKADEIFLTNSIKNIIWVKQFQDKKYNNATAKKMNELIIKSIY